MSIRTFTQTERSAKRYLCGLGWGRQRFGQWLLQGGKYRILGQVLSLFCQELLQLPRIPQLQQLVYWDDLLELQHSLFELLQSAIHIRGRRCNDILSYAE
jgi:hypothetical protein